MRGRERELQVAAECLGDAERGHGGVLLIDGEPGIGKSEILAQVINEAASRDFTLATAEASELAGRSRSRLCSRLCRNWSAG